MFKRKIIIGFISEYNPADKKVSSGTNYKISETLVREGAEVLWLKVSHGALWRIIEKFYRNFFKIFGRSSFFQHTMLSAFMEGRSVDKKLIEKCDILFAPFSSTACLCINTGNSRPLIYLSDATWNIMLDYYIFNADFISKHDGEWIEKRVLRKSGIFICSSQWCYESALNHYQIPEERIVKIHFGANINDSDICDKQWTYKNHLDIVFIGVDWVRKGGAIAVETTKWLNENGVPSMLHIIGAENIDNHLLNLPYIDYVGMLNKNIKEEYHRLISIMQQSHLMLLPTTAECSAIAFCESSAMSLPTYTFRTGGVPDYIEDGVNGRLLALGSSAKDFGVLIKQDLESGMISEMSKLSFHKSKELLNWDVWGVKFSQIVNELL